MHVNTALRLLMPSCSIHECAGPQAAGIRRNKVLQRVAETFSSNSYGDLFRCNQELRLKSGGLATSMMGPAAKDDKPLKKKARMDAGL